MGLAGMKTVMFVNHVSALGGAEKSMLELVSSLDDSKWRPVVVLPGPGPLASRLSELGVPLEYAPMKRLHRTLSIPGLAGGLRHCFRAISAIKAIMARRSPAIVHSNNTTAHLYAGPAARPARVRAIWHVRDLRRNPIVERPLAYLADAVVSVSSAVQGTLDGIQRPGLIKKVVHNALDVGAFSSHAHPHRFKGQLGLRSQELLFVCACQMVPWKRLDLLIDAFGMCIRRGVKAHLAVVGGDLFGEHSDLHATLKNSVVELGLADRVTFTGYREDMASVMAGADVVAVPSSAEPFGRVALEAMALKKPVVGTRAGGLPEVVLDGVTGLLVPSGDAYLLSKAMERLASDAKLRATMGNAGYNRVRNSFGPEKYAREIEDIYCKLVHCRTDQA